LFIHLLDDGITLFKNINFSGDANKEKLQFGLEIITL
jgi:hypothetical protein